MPEGSPFPRTHREPLRKPRRRETFPGVVPSSLPQTHSTAAALVSQLQLKTSLGTTEVSADRQPKGAFSAPPPLRTQSTGRGALAVAVSSSSGGDRQETGQTHCTYATTECLQTSTALLRVPWGRL